MVRTLARELYSLTASQSTLRRILRIAQSMMIASSNYHPQPYPDQITLFRVQKQSAPDDQSQTLGWGKLSAKAVEVVHLPGHHFNILRRPRVQFLAGRLRACIDRVQADQAESIGRELS
jgi:thioesterase domain-containing protein